MTKSTQSETYFELIDYQNAVRSFVVIALLAGILIAVSAYVTDRMMVGAIAAAFALLNLVLLGMVRKGRARSAAYVLLLSVPFMITYLILNGTGLNDPGILGYSATVVCASLLFGRRSILVFSSFVCLHVLFVHLMENHGDKVGWVRPTPVPSNGFDLAIVLILLLVSSGVFWLVIGRIVEQADRLDDLVRLRTRQLEENHRKLERTQEQLIERERMASLGGLVAGVAHEVNTPLGISVTASTYLGQSTEKIQAALSRGTCTEEEFEAYVQKATQSTQMISSNLERAHKLIQNFRQLSVDSSVEVERAFDLVRYIEDVVASLAPELRRREATVSIEAPGPVEVVGVAGKFYQIFTNLIINSLDHGFEDEASNEISIAITRDGPDVRIVYGDNGKGVAPDELRKIFEPFYSTRLGQGSSGLGLSITYNIIVQNFGGTIESSTNSDGGLEFLMVLPDLAASGPRPA